VHSRHLAPINSVNPSLNPPCAPRALRCHIRLDSFRSIEINRGSRFKISLSNIYIRVYIFSSALELGIDIFLPGDFYLWCAGRRDEGRSVEGRAMQWPIRALKRRYCKNMILFRTDSKQNYATVFFSRNVLKITLFSKFKEQCTLIEME
jgi:hypothetical protein